MQLTIYRQEYIPTYCTGAISWNKFLSVHTFWVFHIASISMIHSALVILLLALQFLVDFSLFQNCPPHPVSILEASQKNIFLWGGVVSPTPKLEDQGIPSCLGHHLSGMVCPTSSCATSSIALRIIWPHNPHHYVNVGIPSAGVY
jgi:hypothetical protein